MLRKIRNLFLLVILAGFGFWIYRTHENVKNVMQYDDFVTQTLEKHQGITNLTEMLEYAHEKGVDVWTGVQAYNFGKAYVDYIAKNGGKNTLTLAEGYSKDVVAPSLGNTTGEEYYHITLDSLLFNKGKLYKNGGNIFYAKEVRWNMKIVHLFNW